MNATATIAVLLFSHWASHAAVGPEVCGACTLEDGTARLCAPHLQAERKGIEQNGALVLDADVHRARTALAELAALTASHENAPSPALARALAVGMRNPSWAVRSEALRLLLEGQDQGVTREVLSAAVEAFARDTRECEKLFKEVGELAEDSAADESDDLQEVLESVSATLEKQQRLAAEIAAFQDYTSTLVRAFDRPEDDCVDALLRVAKAVAATDGYEVPVVCALARSGRRDALQAAVDMLDDWQESLRGHEEREKAERRSKLESMPRHFRGTQEAWEQRAQADKDRRVDLARARVEQKLKSGRTMHDAFAELVRARGLGSVPEWNGKPYTVWRSWLQRHRAELPERLAPTPAND